MNVPGHAWSYTVSGEVSCDWCGQPVWSSDAGRHPATNSLEAAVTAARDHERGCAATRKDQPR